MDVVCMWGGGSHPEIHCAVGSELHLHTDERIPHVGL